MSVELNKYLINNKKRKTDMSKKFLTIIALSVIVICQIGSSAPLVAMDMSEEREHVPMALKIKNDFQFFCRLYSGICHFLLKNHGGCNNGASTPVELLNSNATQTSNKSNVINEPLKLSQSRMQSPKKNSSLIFANPMVRETTSNIVHTPKHEVHKYEPLRTTRSNLIESSKNKSYKSTIKRTPDIITSNFIEEKKKINFNINQGNTKDKKRIFELASSPSSVPLKKHHGCSPTVKTPMNELKRLELKDISCISSLQSDPIAQGVGNDEGNPIGLPRSYNSITLQKVGVTPHLKFKPEESHSKKLKSSDSNEEEHSLSEN